MSDHQSFSEKAAREIAADALTYKRPQFEAPLEVTPFVVTSDEVRSADERRDEALAAAIERFKRK